MPTKNVSNLHGDIGLIPATAKPPKNAAKASLHILQESATTQNRHEVFSETSLISRWTDKDGKEYVHCPKPYVIRHVGGDCEHGEQPVEAGTREIRRETEYDPYKNELKIVVD